MNCNCLEEIKERAKRELPIKGDTYKGMIIEKVEFIGEGFIDSDRSIEHTLSIPATLHHQPIGRKKKTEISFTISYCPFCGTPCKEEPNDENRTG